MVQINGKYESVKNENFLEHLVARSVPEDKAKELASERSEVEVIHSGEKITIKTTHKTTEYILNKEVDEKFGDNLTLQSTAVLNGNVLTISSKTTKGPGGKRIYTFSDSDLVIKMEGEKANIPVAVRYFKKL